MKTVWKYELTEREITVQVSQSFQVLSVQDQGGIPCVWILVDSDDTSKRIEILAVGTGHPTPENLNFIGTFQEGRHVWHVFWREA